MIFFYSRLTWRCPHCRCVCVLLSCTRATPEPLPVRAEGATERHTWALTCACWRGYGEAHEARHGVAPAGTDDADTGGPTRRAEQHISTVTEILHTDLQLIWPINYNCYLTHRIWSCTAYTNECSLEYSQHVVWGQAIIIQINSTQNRSLNEEGGALSKFSKFTFLPMNFSWGKKLRGYCVLCTCWFLN